LKAQPKKPVCQFYESFKIPTNGSHFVIYSKELETNLKHFKQDKQTGIHSSWQTHYEVTNARFVNPHTWLDADTDSRQG